MNNFLTSTLGFDWRHTVKAIHTYLKTGDHILILTAKPIEERVKEALKTIQDIARATLETYTFNTVEIDITKPFEATAEIANQLLTQVTTIRPRKLIVDLGGGPRLLVLETYTALLTIKPIIQQYVDQVVIYTWFEGTGTYTELPQEYTELTNTIPNLTQDRIKILKTLLEKGETTLTNLSEELRKDLSTITRQVRKLTEYKLIEVTETRPRKVKLTQLGKTIAKILKTN